MILFNHLTLVFIASVLLSAFSRYEGHRVPEGGGQNDDSSSSEDTQELPSEEGDDDSNSVDELEHLEQQIDGLAHHCTSDMVLSVLEQSINYENATYVKTILVYCSESLPFNTVEYLELFLGLWESESPVNDAIIKAFLEDNQCDVHRLLERFTHALETEATLYQDKPSRGINDGEDDATDKEMFSLSPERLDLLKQHCSWNREAIAELYRHGPRYCNHDGLKFLNDWYHLATAIDPAWPFRAAALHNTMWQRQRMASLAVHLDCRGNIYSLPKVPKKGKIKTSTYWKYVTETIAAMITRTASLKLHQHLLEDLEGSLSRTMRSGIKSHETIAFGRYLIDNGYLRLVSGGGIEVSIIKIKSIQGSEAFETRTICDSIWGTDAKCLSEYLLPFLPEESWIVLMGPKANWTQFMSMVQFKEILRYADLETFSDMIRDWVFMHKKFAPDFIISWI